MTRPPDDTRGDQAGTFGPGWRAGLGPAGTLGGGRAAAAADPTQCGPDGPGHGPGHGPSDRPIKSGALKAPGRGVAALAHRATS